MTEQRHESLVSGGTSASPAALRPERSADPGEVIRTCANCGARMEERKCKLLCHGCGYFLSCADYY